MKPAVVLLITTCIFPTMHLLAQNAPVMQSAFELDISPDLKSRPPRFVPDKRDSLLLNITGDHIPLGSDSVSLTHSNDHAAFFVSAESQDFAGLRVYERENTRYVVDFNGDPVSSLPPHITFRITASDKLKLLDRPYPIDLACDAQHLIDGLRVEAKVFRGLSARKLAPISIDNIGMPLTYPSDERIYRAAFDFGHLRITDRIVLSLLAPDGTPITKFFLQFK